MNPQHNELLKNAAAEIEAVKPRIAEVEDMLNMMEQAGEEVTEQRTKLRELKTRATKWDATLRTRGLVK